MSYNLLDEGWIPVLWHDGRAERVGIKTALLEAGKIRQIAATNPMDRVALLRFLLAVLYWCRGNPSSQDEKDQVLAGGGFPADWFAELEQQRECFNLLGEGPRFSQDASAKRERPASDLVQEIPTGNNFWHFKHATDGTEGLCPSCCALGLLRLPLFSVSGLPDLKAGINGTPPVYVIPIGDSLLHTLALNWTPCASLGTPTWAVPSARLEDGNPVPLLAGLTMLSRRVWLHPPGPPGGPCVSCGSAQSGLIRTCEYQTAGSQQNDRWDDPHVLYVRSAKTSKGGDARKTITAPDLTKSFFRLDKPWIPLIVHIASSRAEPVSLLIVGFATDKAKNIDVWERRCHIPLQTFEADALGRVSCLERWQDGGASLPARMKRRGGISRGIEHVVAVTAIRPHVESLVSGRVTDLLADGDQGWARAVQEYQQMMRVVAKSLAPGCTTRALQRRHQIANTLPELTPREANKTRKPRGKKRGAQ